MHVRFYEISQEKQNTYIHTHISELALSPQPLYACIYVNMYMYVCMYFYETRQVRKAVSFEADVSIYVCTYIHVPIYIYTCIYVCMYILRV